MHVNGTQLTLDWEGFKSQVVPRNHHEFLTFLYKNKCFKHHIAAA